ncbi:thioredoxin family protein [Alkalicoccus chagannorensis]|uniref:thioredoxin family protein n=1 Tax=Alkalicoccus chagannorensis TaxID=427072 RepID=UPI0004072CF6|nr:thioredoxin family protein [Alkalicoccus chagannorensis]
MSNAIEETSTFEEVIASDEPVIVRFTAGWCPDCRRMEAFFPTVEEQFEHLPMYEVDRDQLPDIADKYDVMGIPSLLIFKNDEKIGHLHSKHAKTPEETQEFLSGYFK